ncbi:hypothetical protein FOA52_006589 [Chlamydomonas sp. UWO 241]|nr:hypothetical protein FOA52_006589 [Chlamydomonas sp. UWO 241]
MGCGASIASQPKDGGSPTHKTLDQALGSSHEGEAPAVIEGSWMKATGSKMLVLARNSLPAAQTALSKLGDVLPFPGSTACSVLSVILGLVDTALTNRDYVRDLALRSADLMDIVVESQMQFVGKPHEYQRILSRFGDLLQEIEDFAKEYSGRNVFFQVVASTGDKDHRLELLQKLQELRGDATLAVTVKIHGAVMGVHAVAVRMDAKLNSLADKLAPFVGDKARVLAALEELGGEKEVMADVDKRREFTTSLGIESKMVLAAIESLAAEKNKGVHRLIKHADMRVFWYSIFLSTEKVSWDTWWMAFPEYLKDAQVDDKVVLQLDALLQTPEAKKAFQAAIEKHDSEHISIREVNIGFPKDTDLVDVVSGMVTGIVTVIVCDDDGDKGNDTTASAAPGHVSHTAGSFGFDLPAVDLLYVERERGYVDGLMAHLKPGDATAAYARCMCLVGGAGLGKSSIALDVGKQLSIRGMTLGGALLVDLREARSLCDVEGRFCAAAGVDKGSDATAALLARLERVPGPFLLVVDNAEDTLQGPEPDALPSLLQKVLSTVANAMVLVTSRQKLPTPLAACKAGGGAGSAVAVVNVDLTHLGRESAEKLVCSMPSARALVDAEVDAVLGGSQGNPLLLRVLTDALASRSISLADVQRAAAASTAVAASAASAASAVAEEASEAVVAIVALTIRALPDERLREALAQLSAFPSGWDPEGGAMVMGCGEVRATSLVRQLYRHGLALYDSSTGRHYLHMAVRSAATASVEGRAEKEAAEERFARYVLGLMTDWSSWMGGKAYGQSLREARSHDSDVTALLHILGRRQLAMATATAAVDAVPQLDALMGAINLLTSKLSLAAWRNVAEVLSHAPGPQPGMAAAQLCISLHLRAQGDRRAALTSAQAALEARERTLGPEHPDTLRSVGNLAVCLRFLGREAEALPLDQRTLEARERTLGPEHPDTLMSVNSLAVCLEILGRSAEALPLNQRTLEASERTLGPEHPGTLFSVSELADCLWALGRSAEALPLYQRTLEARERTLGPEHPDTLRSVGNLAVFLQLKGRYAEALPLCQRTLEARERTLGPEHPDTLASVNNLATCLDGLGRKVAPESGATFRRRSGSFRVLPLLRDAR